MKKIGILFGQENTFPQAFIDRINSKKIDGIMAEAVTVDKVAQGEPTEYAVIVDRISQDVPFYRAYLKNAAIGGTAVINNPFWWSADEKFFNNALAQSVGVAVPNTVILPSHSRPDDTDENSFRNLKFPIDWEGIFEYVGFPAYMKPHSGGGWKSVYRVTDADDLFKKHAETDQLVMMLQEEIEFSEYFRCYCLGGDDVHIMQYEPRNPHHLRYVKDGPPVPKSILDKVHEGVIKLNKALGYDFNTVEFAVRDGVPYAIDFCNPAPDADVNSVGEENFEWIVEHAAQLAIKKAKDHKPGQMNLTWGTFVKKASADTPVKGKPGRKAGSKKAAPAKKAAPVKKEPAKSKVVQTNPNKVQKATPQGKPEEKSSDMPKRMMDKKAAKSQSKTVKSAAVKSPKIKKASAPKPKAVKKPVAPKAKVNKSAPPKVAKMKVTPKKGVTKKTDAKKADAKKATPKKSVIKKASTKISDAIKAATKVSENKS